MLPALEIASPSACNIVIDNTIAAVRKDTPQKIKW